jgi:hypothetical protein
MRRALVFSGGGSRGSWQVGACQHLITEGGYWFDVISGVSVGAINGATLAHAQDQNELNAHLERLRSVWFGLRGNHDIYRRRRFGALRMFAGWSRGLCDVAPLREILRREIDPPRVAASPIQLRVGYYDLLSRRHRTAGNDHPGLRNVVLASSSLPFFFPPTPLGSGTELGIDGGVGGAVPVAAALSALAELPPDGDPPEVWVLRPQPPRSTTSAEKWFRRAVRSLSRDEVAPRLRGVRLKVLHPRRALPGSYLDFAPKEIRLCYEDGLLTARDWRKQAPLATAFGPGELRA